MCIHRLTILTSYLSFYVKKTKTSSAFIMKQKKKNRLGSFIYIKSFAFIQNNHLKVAVGQRKFVTFKVFFNVMMRQDSIHSTTT